MGTTASGTSQFPLWVEIAVGLTLPTDFRLAQEPKSVDDVSRASRTQGETMHYCS